MANEVCYRTLGLDRSWSLEPTGVWGVTKPGGKSWPGN